MVSFKEGYKKYCSTKCVNQSEEHKQHLAESKELKYGDKNLDAIYNGGCKYFRRCKAPDLYFSYCQRKLSCHEV